MVFAGYNRYGRHFGRIPPPAAGAFRPPVHRTGAGGYSMNSTFVTLPFSKTTYVATSVLAPLLVSEA